MSLPGTRVINADAFIHMLKSVAVNQKIETHGLRADDTTLLVGKVMNTISESGIEASYTCEFSFPVSDPDSITFSPGRLNVELSFDVSTSHSDIFDSNSVEILVFEHTSIVSLSPETLRKTAKIIPFPTERTRKPWELG